MTATKIRPVQATAPERIYLQGGPQLPPETEFGSLSEATWCRDDVDGTGIPYVRADIAGAAPAAVAGPAPAGWRLVPAVPTRDWIAAMADGGYEDCDCASLIADILSRAPAAPALEAPSAISGRTTPRNDDERAAAQFFADNPRAALLAWPLYLARDKAPALEAPTAPALPADEFRGDTPSLVRNIIALLELDAEGALVPHGVGGHARGLLSAAAARLAAAPQAPAAPIAPAATMFHDAGAIAQCACGRYTLDRNSLSPRDDRRPVCECGTNHGWSGSFKKPGADSKWHGPAPAPEAAPAAPAVDAPALGEWVATLEVDSEGGLDYETVPPCTLPAGCYPLYRAAQAKEGGAAC